MLALLILTRHLNLVKRPENWRVASLQKKATAVLTHIPENEDWVILAADTVVAQGRRILPKAETQETAKACLKLLSGRAHRVFSGVCLIYKGKSMLRVADTRVVMKRLSAEEITTYLDSQEWRGKAGGYAIQGRADAFVKSLNGSYSNVVGLPLYETSSLLAGIGFKGGQNEHND